MACSLCDYYVYPRHNIAASEDLQANSKVIEGYYPTKFLLPGLIGES